MGFDLFAENDDVGRFHDTVWSWIPTWSMCLAIAGDVIPPDLGARGFRNVGAKLTARQCAQLADRLSAVMLSGFDPDAWMPEFPEECDKKRRAWGQQWSLDAQTVVELVEFLRRCGGCEIW